MDEKSLPHSHSDDAAKIADAAAFFPRCADRQAGEASRERARRRSRGSVRRQGVGRSHPTTAGRSSTEAQEDQPSQAGTPRA